MFLSSSEVAAAPGRGVNELFPAAYHELRALAAACLKRERAGHTLQPTALANEVYLKIAGSGREEFADGAQLMAAAAQAIRRVLIDHARGKRSRKRGGGARGVELDTVRLGRKDAAVALVDFDDALSVLEKLNARVARVVEMRVYGEMSVAQVAEAMGMAASTVSSDWATARAWLRARLG